MSSNTHQSPMERNTAFMVKVEDLVREIIIQNNIPYYRIESRMEHVHGAEGHSYLPVVRVVTYFEDSVGPIAAILRSEFDVEMGAPREKEVIKADSFSSKHIAYKVALKANRLDLIEYKRYGTKQFEIHACSMIQDAWNGLENELGYNGSSIPAEARRDFYRVGALLEMAEIEFLKIRGMLNSNNPQEVTTAKKEREEQPVNATQPAIKETAPQPQVAAKPVQETTVPIKEAAAIPMKEAERPPINIFSFKPTAYQPEPPVIPPVMEEPAAAIKEVKTVINGLAPQKVSLGNMNGYTNEPVTANGNSINNINRPTGIAEEVVSGLVMNMMPVREEPATEVQQQTANIAPSIDAPRVPMAEKAPEPVQPDTINANTINTNTINAERLNINASGIVEKMTEAIREQPATAQFYDEKPKNQPQTIDENAQMTDGSLKEYVRNSKLLREIDLKISASASAKLNDDIDIEGDVERLKFLKVFSLKQLHERLADNRNDIVAFAEKWIGKDNGGSFDMGISLFYLEYLLVGKRNDPGFAVEYVLKFISDNDYSARYIIPTYNAIRQSDSSAPKFSHLTLK